MEIIIFDGFWSVNDVRLKTEFLFIFGDNDIKKGKGGQAIIRDEPNTFGIPTKKLPNNNLNSFYYDSEYDENIKKIDRAFENLFVECKKYKGVVLPKDGIGTGLAKLSKNAPKTLSYLNKKLAEFVNEIKYT